MASPIEDLQAVGRKLRGAGNAAMDEQPRDTAAAGTTTAVLRHMPGQIPVAPSGPTAPPAAPSTGMNRLIAGARNAGSALANVPGALARGTSNVLRNPTALGAGGTALAAAPEALRVGDVLANKNSTWNDVGTQAAEGVGRIASAGAGAAGGATLGAGIGSIVPGVGTAVGGVLGGLAGGAYGYWAGDKAIKGLRSAADVDPSSPASRLAPSAPTPTTPGAPPADPPIATYSNEGVGKAPTGRPSNAPSLSDPNGAIYRDGNSFSGKDVKFGAGVYNPDGSVRPSGGLIRNQDVTNPDGSVTKSTLRGGGTVTSLDTSEGHRQNLLELQRNAAERANAAPVGGATDMGGRTSMLDDLVAKSKSGGPDLSRLPPVRRAQMEASLRQSQDANANALNIAGLHDSTARAGMGSAQAIAAMHDATQRRSNDQNNATSLRGQDITYAGHMAPLQLAAMQRAQAAQVYQNLGHDGKSDITPDMHRKAGDMMNALGLKDMAKDAYGAAASGQAITGTQDDQKRKGHEDLVDVFRSDDRFNSPDPKNPGRMIFDADGAKQAAAGLFAAHGERLSKLPADQKKQAAAEIVARSRLQERLRQPEMSAMDHVKSWVGQYDRPADNNQLPDLSGARGLRRGATLIPGNNTNDRLIETKDGRRYNAGLLSDAEAKVLRDEGVR